MTGDDKKKKKLGKTLRSVTMTFGHLDIYLGMIVDNSLEIHRHGGFICLNI
jgi:hypothetical protein